MPTRAYFPTLLYVEPDYNHPSLKLENILSECYNVIDNSGELNRPWDELLYSSFKYNTHGNILTSLPLLKEYIEYHTTKYISEVNFNDPQAKYRYNFYESWFNVSPENGYMNYHSHGVFDISGAFYVKTLGDGTDGRFCFRSDSTGHRVTKFLHHGGLDPYIDPKIGTLILFPSYLEHCVSANKTKSERISISFNIGIY